MWYLRTYVHAGRRADFFCGVYQLETRFARIIHTNTCGPPRAALPTCPPSGRCPSSEKKSVPPVYGGKQVLPPACYVQVIQYPRTSRAGLINLRRVFPSTASKSTESTQEPSRARWKQREVLSQRERGLYRNTCISYVEVWELKLYFYPSGGGYF